MGMYILISYCLLVSFFMVSPLPFPLPVPVWRLTFWANTWFFTLFSGNPVVPTSFASQLWQLYCVHIYNSILLWVYKVFGFCKSRKVYIPQYITFLNMPFEKKYIVRPANKGKLGEKGKEVTLLPEWCKYHNVETGDEVKVLADGVVVILPPNISKEEEERVRNFLERNEDGK